MAERYKCPYCGVAFYESADNTKERRISFWNNQEEFERICTYSCIRADIVATYHYCPACHEYSIQMASTELDRIVLETDCPYLSPEPNRGKRNSSLNLNYVAEALSQIKGINKEELIAVTEENARQLYRMKEV